MKTEITAKTVISLLELFDKHGIEVYVDGGWAVDALLGKQTRSHSDLDIAMPHKHVPALRQILEKKNYNDVPRDDTKDCNFVMGDLQGNQVDIHTYTFDENGKNIFGIPYEPQHLIGTGTILGKKVKCIPPDVLVTFHTGYEVDEDDWHDVSRLCKKFHLPIPDDYKDFQK